MAQHDKHTGPPSFLEGTVLCIEDHPLHMEIVEAVVGAHAGIRFVKAYNGRDGVMLAHTERPDLVLLDMNLPDITGLDVVRELSVLISQRDLRVVLHEVGRDATRYFLVARSPDSQLVFDIDLAKSQSNENPVYYIQYAHARICSVLQQWGGDVAGLAAHSLEPLNDERGLALCARLQAWPETVATAAAEYAPHQIAVYLKDLAADFHGWYNAERMLVDDAAVKHARLALAAATRIVCATASTCWAFRHRRACKYEQDISHSQRGNTFVGLLSAWCWAWSSPPAWSGI